jgi:hypothetical protein
MRGWPAGIDRYSNSPKRQADFISCRFASPFAGDGAWIPLALVANKIVSALREKLQERHLERPTITTGAGESPRPFEDEVGL